MPFITREDGEHFVIPSYRDVLTVKQKSRFKKEVETLSQSYGEYITMQRKSALQYEVAFSLDRGYLLGETAWQYFKRPTDMIYCEILPNATEAVLVIVKEESVYLDGSYPVENIEEELVILLTQQNSYDIYIYGDVPISEQAERGKFSLDPALVKSFTILEKSALENFTLEKAYQFRPVDGVLKEHGIGTVPVKLYLGILVALILLGLLYSYMTREVVVVEPPKVEVNPYQAFLDTLASPAPDESMAAFVRMLNILYEAPGWEFKTVDYTGGSTSASVISNGTSIKTLMDWGYQKNVDVSIKTSGIFISTTEPLVSRTKPKTIYPMKEILAVFLDNIAKVYPGNNLMLTTVNDAPSGPNEPPIPFITTKIVIQVTNCSPILFAMIGEQFKGMPFALDGINLTSQDGMLLTGTIALRALGR